MKAFNGVCYQTNIDVICRQETCWIFISYNSNKFFFHFPGIVPVFCEQIFVGIDEKKQAGDTGQYEVLLRNICNNWLCNYFHLLPAKLMNLSAKKHQIISQTH